MSVGEPLVRKIGGFEVLRVLEIEKADFTSLLDTSADADFCEGETRVTKNAFILHIPDYHRIVWAGYPATTGRHTLQGL